MASAVGTYFCSIDNFKLALFDKKTGEWICSRCYKSFLLCKSRASKASRQFTTPGPETDVHGNMIGEGSDDVLVSYTPDVNYNSSNIYGISTKYYKKENKPLPPPFEQLRKKGFKITHYEEKVGLPD